MWKLYFIPVSILILSVGTQFILCCQSQPAFRPHQVPDNSVGVVGGQTATPGQFPYQVAVFRHGQQICGGSLAEGAMGNQYIVSAAHCFGGSAQEYTILAGSITVDGSNSNPPAQTIRVKQIIIHPDYQTWPVENDIALLFLERDFELNSNVGPVKLPFQGQDTIGNVTVSGWGSTQQRPASCPLPQSISQFREDNFPNLLQYVIVPVIPNPECANLYSQCYGNMEVIFQSDVCAGDVNGGFDSCQGDSGGPAVGEYQGQKVLFGIVSWGQGCAWPGYPGVYTRVSEFINWIDRETFD